MLELLVWLTVSLSATQSFYLPITKKALKGEKHQIWKLIEVPGMRLAFLITTVFHRLFQSRKNKQKWLVLLSLGSRLKITWHLIILQHVDWLKTPPSVLFDWQAGSGLVYCVLLTPTSHHIIVCYCCRESVWLWLNCFLCLLLEIIWL